MRADTADKSLIVQLLKNHPPCIPSFPHTQISFLCWRICAHVHLLLTVCAHSVWFSGTNLKQVPSLCLYMKYERHTSVFFFLCTVSLFSTGVVQLWRSNVFLNLWHGLCLWQANCAKNIKDLMHFKSFFAIHGVLWIDMDVESVGILLWVGQVTYTVHVAQRFYRWTVDSIPSVISKVKNKQHPTPLIFASVIIVGASRVQAKGSFQFFLWLATTTAKGMFFFFYSFRL